MPTFTGKVKFLSQMRIAKKKRAPSNTPYLATLCEKLKAGGEDARDYREWESCESLYRRKRKQTENGNSKTPAWRNRVTFCNGTI